MTHPGYVKTASDLADRILGLIDANPQIMRMENPNELFSVAGFKCDDLEPSLAQAMVALRDAQLRYANGER